MYQVSHFMSNLCSITEPYEADGEEEENDRDTYNVERQQ